MVRDWFWQLESGNKSNSENQASRTMAGILFVGYKVLNQFSPTCNIFTPSHKYPVYYSC